MPLVNSAAGYGVLTKLFHWLIALLIILQYTSANIMLRTPA
jgi:cytochrome b561